MSDELDPRLRFARQSLRCMHLPSESLDFVGSAVASDRGRVPRVKDIPEPYRFFFYIERGCWGHGMSTVARSDARI